MFQSLKESKGWWGLIFPVERLRYDERNPKQTKIERKYLREREYSKNDEKCSQWYDDTLPSTESLHRMI